MTAQYWCILPLFLFFLPFLIPTPKSQGDYDFGRAFIAIGKIFVCWALCIGTIIGLCIGTIIGHFL